MKKLLVSDLDETLIHASETSLRRAPDFKVFSYSVYRRPYLSEFLAFCDAHFAVAVWSSASDDYVQAIVRQIFAQPERLIAVWGSSKTMIRRSHPGDCDRFGQPLPEYHDQKRLQKLTRFSWSLDKMLMVDDSHERCSVNFAMRSNPRPFTATQRMKSYAIWRAIFTASSTAIGSAGLKSWAGGPRRCCCGGSTRIRSGDPSAMQHLSANMFVPEIGAALKKWHD